MEGTEPDELLPLMIARLVDRPQPQGTGGDSFARVPFLDELDEQAPPVVDEPYQLGGEGAALQVAAVVSMPTPPSSPARCLST